MIKDSFGRKVKPTHKFLSVIISEELLQLQIPVVSAFKDAVLHQRLAHVASPRVKIPSVVRRSRVNQNVQTVYAEAPAGSGSD